MKQQCFCQSIRFTFDGQRVTGADTAASLGLEEGDTIEVFQVGFVKDCSYINCLNHAISGQSWRHEVKGTCDRHGLGHRGSMSVGWSIEVSTKIKILI